MTNTMTRSLIESFIRKKIIELRISPGRATRNLVDMGLNFSNGRFQKYFFELAQNILCDEKSTYYQIAHSVVNNINAEKLLGFSMNLGYNSFTYGAKIIRKNEAEFNCNIPWCITLTLNRDILTSNPEYYHKVLNEGKALGIYTYFIFTNNQLEQFLPIIDMNNDCAFILFSTPEELTDNLLDIAETINNLMFVVKYEESRADIFNILLNKKFLHSTYFYGGDYVLSDIMNNELLCTLNATNAVFAVMLPDPLLSNEEQEVLYNYILGSRKDPIYKTLLWDFEHDNQRIDSIISDDSCYACFDADGYMLQDSNLNIFSKPLLYIFQSAFPKSKQETA